MDFAGDAGAGMTVDRFAGDVLTDTRAGSFVETVAIFGSLEWRSIDDPLSVTPSSKHTLLTDWVCTNKISDKRVMRRRQCPENNQSRMRCGGWGGDGRNVLLA